MRLQPSQPSFIRAAWRPLAAGLASLALCAYLHCSMAPPPAPETVDLDCKLSRLAPLAGVDRDARAAGAVASRRGWARE